MKDSFILHHDTLSVINELSDEQAGQLIKEIFSYSLYINNPNKAKKPTGLNGLMNSVLHPFKMQLDRDLTKYLRVVERNQENGKKGGRPKKVENPKKPKKADSDNGNDSDSDKDIYIYVQNLWNRFALKHNLSKVAKISVKRKNKIKARLKEVKDFKGIYLKVLTIADESSFLLGENKNSWTISFDWLIENDTNYLKVLEGKYNG